MVYLTQWRPRLIVDADGFEGVNGLRRHRIPFAAVDDIEVRHTVALTAGGKKYVSWVLVLGLILAGRCLAKVLL
ncbi:PH domain-containing protein [Arthrobacter sp. UKPF54-2]|nr:PH domain-containing protein [Arthrobacter sp. UKPF54-2]